MKATGPLSYQVELLSGNVVRRHVDAVRNREVGYPQPYPSTEYSASRMEEDDFYLPDIPATPAIPLPPRPCRSDRHCPPPNQLWSWSWRGKVWWTTKQETTYFISIIILSV